MNNKQLLIAHLTQTNPYKAPELIENAATELFGQYPIEIDDYFHEGHNKTLLQCLRDTPTSQRALKMRIEMLHSVKLY
ncbi:hypothetical protein [Staphylococcus petrasii]|uniref:hypothetical protein n=1 Tax=Staphylococcus petrasii TaxID=1276936 RepID=UPI003F67047B